ncbi:uncharacterized protein ACIQIH_009050 [Cyanocitta cristata]
MPELGGRLPGRRSQPRRSSIHTTSAEGLPPARSAEPSRTRRAGGGERQESRGWRGRGETCRTVRGIQVATPESLFPFQPPGQRFLSVHRGHGGRRAPEGTFHVIPERSFLPGDTAGFGSALAARGAVILAVRELRPTVQAGSAGAGGRDVAVPAAGRTRSHQRQGEGSCRLPAELLMNNHPGVGGVASTSRRGAAAGSGYSRSTRGRAGPAALSLARCHRALWESWHRKRRRGHHPATPPGRSARTLTPLQRQQ